MTASIQKLSKIFGGETVTRNQIADAVKSNKLPGKEVWGLINDFKVARGNYNFSSVGGSVVNDIAKEVKASLSDDQVRQRIESRFSTLELMTKASAAGINRSMIVSGPAGLGKSYTVEKEIENLPEERVIKVKGMVRPTGLYATLYNYRFPGCVVVFDDADAIFNDEIALNILKAACDSGEKRRLSWLSARPLEIDGEEIPSTFDFEGTVIFITNYDFDALIAKGSKLAPHFNALMSRSHYVDLGIKTTQDYMVRIRMVSEVMMRDFDKSVVNDVMNFVSTNKDKLRELSLRVIKKLIDLVRIAPNDWKQLAQDTMFKSGV